MIRTPLLTVAAVLCGLLAAGCNLDVFHDSISTTIEVPLQQYDEPLTSAKRFKFERDVAAAAGARLDRAWVAVNSPSALDLSFVSTVEVYGIDPNTGDKVLLVEGGGFRSGDQLVALDVVYQEDVRSFVQDQRVNLEWHVRQNRLFRDWPAADKAELRFGIVLAIDTQQ